MDPVATAKELHKGIWEAYAEEERDRETLYLGGQYPVAGVMLPAMNGRSYTALCAIGNPYICGGRTTRSDACKLMWTVWQQLPLRGLDRFRSVESRRIRFLKRIDLDLAQMDVSAYVSFIMMDAPRGSGSGSPSSVAANFAYAAHVILMNYNETMESVMSIDLPRIYQHVKLIRVATDPDYKPKAGAKTAEASRRYTAHINENGLTDADVWQRN